MNLKCGWTKGRFTVEGEEEMKKLIYKYVVRKPNRLCECGAWAIGAADYSAGHQNSPSFTCPAFKMYKDTDNTVEKVRAQQGNLYNGSALRRP